MSWYRFIHLKYGRSDDIEISSKELDVLFDLYNRHTSKVKDKKVSINKKVFEGLLEKKLLCSYLDESNSRHTHFTEEGLLYVKDLHNRFNYPSTKTVGNHIRKERENSNMTRKALSQQTDIKYQRLYRIENNNDLLYMEELEKICEFLDIDMEQILKDLKQREIDDVRKFEDKLTGFGKEISRRHISHTRKSQHLKIPNVILPDKSINHDNYKILISESPIETKLLKEIIKLKNTYNFDIDTQVDFSVNSRNYRAEIFIEFKESQSKSRKILIECDGHDFHEKTKEQAQKDKQRDRDFLSAGIVTIRFTGSEIWKNANKCAEEIFSAYRGFQEAISL